MDLIDLEDETIDAEVMDSLAVSMDNFRVSACHMEKHLYKHYKWKERRRKVRRERNELMLRSWTLWLSQWTTSE